MAILQLIPLLVVLAVYAGFLKLAARFRRFSGVRWAHCLAFSSMIIALAVSARALAVFGGLSLPPFVHTVVGALVHLGLASWFFRARGKTPSGQPLGSWGGVQMALMAMAMLLCTAGLLFVLVYTLAPNAQP